MTSSAQSGLELTETLARSNSESSSSRSEKKYLFVVQIKYLVAWSGLKEEEDGRRGEEENCEKERVEEDM